MPKVVFLGESGWHTVDVNNFVPSTSIIMGGGGLGKSDFYGYTDMLLHQNQFCTKRKKNNSPVV